MLNLSITELRSIAKIRGIEKDNNLVIKEYFTFIFII